MASVVFYEACRMPPEGPLMCTSTLEYLLLPQKGRKTSASGDDIFTQYLIQKV